jgi:hypothetical protein
MRSIGLSIFVASSLLICLGYSAQAQNTAQTASTAEISADLGNCSADITVTGSDSMPVYSARVATRVHYGMMGVKKLDLEAFTGPDGKVTIAKLPRELKKPMYIHISKGDKEEMVEFKPSLRCHAVFDVQLTHDKPRDDNDSNP